MAENGAAPRTRGYTVCRVGSDSLSVLDVGVDARSQEHACDLVVESLSAQDRNGVFAAFLSGSYREFEYSARQVVATTKKERQPSFEREVATGPIELTG